MANNTRSASSGQAWQIALRFSLLTLTVFYLLTSSVSAASEYVLPYPSFMPGSKFYTVHLLWEKAMAHWYFGSFSQFRYNLSLSDKYVVEAKTLLEYKQYFFVYRALQKSDGYFMNALNELTNAQKENKNIDQKQNILRSASLKHIEVLEHLKKIVPVEFIWQEEKKDSVKLPLKGAIDTSITIRKRI